MNKAVLGKFAAVLTAVFMLLALSPALAMSGTAYGHEIHPLRDPKGNVLRTPSGQVQSSNWSGYVKAQYATGQQYKEATGNWVVPAVTAPSSQSNGYSSSWVGVGGFCLNSACTRVDNSLIQLGTEGDASPSGATQYYAWYEMLPNPEIKISGLTVNPGDSITASLQVVSSNRKSQTWQLTLTDNNTGAIWSNKLNYKSSLASADWIEEAPYSGGILPLANYGTATFDPEVANNSSPAFVTADSIMMVNSNGQTSNPSAPDTDNDGFNACWGNGTNITTCVPPNS